MHNDPNIHINPFIFEINTRVWIKRFSAEEKAKFYNIPEDYWASLTEKGFNYVWLMGIWETSRSSIKKYCFTNDLVQEYKSALADFTEEDVIGSPYSIEDYIVNPDLGDEESLLQLKKQINAAGLKLILDFIPNHFNVESKLVEEKPELFLQGTEENLKSDLSTFFEKNGRIFAHGKDPFYEAWQDTVQVNYFSKDARRLMIEKLKRLAKFCDGVRCDMAMLINNSVFEKTWEKIKPGQNEIPKTEFWEEAIQSIKIENPNFVFIGEAYWEKGYELQQFGFDFTYDKRFLERLIKGNVNDIKAHLWAEDEFQKRSLRFLENHDEQRVAKIFEIKKAKAAAVALTTSQGMKLIYDGQITGRKIKLPVQLRREPKEQTLEELKLFYQKLFSITKKNIFRYGKWEPVEPDPAWEGNTTHNNFLVWAWKHLDERILVVINFSDEISQCSLQIDTKDFENEFPLKDILNDVKYVRSAKEIDNIGLFVELQSFQSHIFYY